jgi:hypothetical protein
MFSLALLCSIGKCPFCNHPPRRGLSCLSHDCVSRQRLPRALGRRQLEPKIIEIRSSHCESPLSACPLYPRTGLSLTHVLPCFIHAWPASHSVTLSPEFLHWYTNLCLTGPLEGLNEVWRGRHCGWQ